jgi:hypothetical protein
VAKHYAAMIEALSMVIVYLQADFQHLALGPAIAAYVSLMNLKEAVGMERAIVGGMLAGKTERFTASSYSDLVRSQPHHPVSLLLRPGALPTPPPGQPPTPTWCAPNPTTRSAEPWTRVHTMRLTLQYERPHPLRWFPFLPL